MPENLGAITEYSKQLVKEFPRNSMGGGLNNSNSNALLNRLKNRHQSMNIQGSDEMSNMQMQSMNSMISLGGDQQTTT